ncbi:MAG: hypothetical protein D6797_02895 [Bdellovibrio sp.]|nr:MAG: hypothetical protein D6797_02895 [Bdellovibrio sp.]
METKVKLFFILLLLNANMTLAYEREQDALSLLSQVQNYIMTDAPLYVSSEIADGILSLNKEDYKTVLNELKKLHYDDPVKSKRFWYLLKQLESQCEAEIGLTPFSDPLKFQERFASNYNNRSMEGALIGLTIFAASLLKHPSKLPGFFVATRTLFPFTGALIGQEIADQENQYQEQKLKNRPCPAYVLNFGQTPDALSPDQLESLQSSFLLGAIAASFPSDIKILPSSMRRTISFLKTAKDISFSGSRFFKQFLISGAAFLTAEKIFSFTFEKGYRSYLHSQIQDDINLVLLSKIQNQFIEPLLENLLFLINKYYVTITSDIVLINKKMHQKTIKIEEDQNKELLKELKDLARKQAFQDPKNKSLRKSLFEKKVQEQLQKMIQNKEPSQVFKKHQKILNARIERLYKDFNKEIEDTINKWGSSKEREIVQKIKVPQLLSTEERQRIHKILLEDFEAGRFSDHPYLFIYQAQLFFQKYSQHPRFFINMLPFQAPDLLNKK